MSLLAANPSVGEFLLWCLWVFLFVVWFWLLITIFADLFRRHDIGGWAKVGWFLFVIVFTFLGILIYLLTQHQGMAERNMQQAQVDREAARQYLGVAGADPADQLMKLDQLKASGSLSDEEYQAMRAKVING